MKRYWLFAYDSYYPNGGMSDFVASFDTLQEALKMGPANSDCRSFDFFDVLDVEKSVLYTSTKGRTIPFLPSSPEWKIVPTSIPAEQDEEDLI